jgi:hypothetical protein
LSGEAKVKAHLEVGEIKVDFEGDVNQVFESIIRFLSQLYPNIEILQRIFFTPDLAKLSSSIAGLVEITPEGPIIAPNVDLTARSAICLVLLGAYIGVKLGRLQKDSLATNDLSKFTGKARKTVINELPRLIEEGLIEKVSEGEYRITTLGMRRIEEIVESLKKR